MQTQYSTYRKLLAHVSGQGISEAEAQDILRQILSCLSELHDRQQAHGAISLDTLAYDYRRMEVILLGVDEANNPIYLAPEVTQTQQVTPAADIYSLGICVIELLTGLPPASLRSADNTWNWQAHCHVSAQLQQVLTTALLADPALRFVNAGQMLRSLQPSINHALSTLTNHHTTRSLIAISAQSSSVQPALALGASSAETHSLELLALESQPSRTTSKPKNKKLKISFPNSQIHRKAKVAQQTSQASPKGGIPILFAILFGLGTTISGAVGSYFYMQPKFANSTKGDVELANVVNQSMDKAIAHAYEERKTNTNKAKLVALDKEANKDANIGGLSSSKTILQTIPFGSRMRAKAEQFLTQSTETNKGNDLIQKLGAVAKTEKLLSALGTFKSITPSAESQSRGKDVVEEAKQKLPEPTVALSSPSATSSSLTTTDIPRSPSTETYNPPAETAPPPVEAYVPPVETSYKPTVEKSGLPVPPAPRVAN